MAATPKKPKAAIKGAVKRAPPGSAAVIAKTARAGAVGGTTKPRIETKAVRRADGVKAKIKAQVAGLSTTRDARTTRVRAAVKAKRTPPRSARGKSARTSGVSTVIAKDKSARGGAVVAKPTSARTRIEAAVAAVKAKVVKGRRVASTEEREAAALAIADVHATPPEPRLRAASDGGTTGAPANESASTLSAAPLATIAPRGVFLPDRVVVDVEGDTFPRTKLDEHGRDEAVLSGSAFDALEQQASEGERLVDGDAPAAFRAFRAALELLPEPVQNWNAAGWLLVAMGECAIRTGDFAAALAPLKDAMHCPGTIGNPWVHLLLGRCRLELGDERAADELARAYMGGGRALFDELDPKYFALVEHVLKPPPGHDRLP